MILPLRAQRHSRSYPTRADEILERVTALHQIAAGMMWDRARLIWIRRVRSVDHRRH
jgi:hypothetical protein